MPLLRRPPEGAREDGDPFATNPEGRRRRRATLGGLVGLGGQLGGHLGHLGGHLGHLGGPFGRGRRPRDAPGPRGRRRSEDSGVARRPPEEAGGGKRGSLLRLALGTWGQRGTEKVSPVEGQAGDGADGAGARRESGGRDKGGDRDGDRDREPLSVLEILELIQRRDLVAADAQIIALEAECSLSPSRPPSPCPLPASPSSSSSSSATPPPSPVPAGGRRARDVALLYRALLSQLWAVVAESVAAGRAVAPLRAVVAVLEQEEAADARSPPGTRPGRPRGLRRRWHQAVARAASERLAQVAPAGGLGARLAALAARVVGDLGVVRSHVAPAYPPEYGALGVYARGYHRALAQQVSALAQRPLDVPELYLLLDWHSNAYPREVLGHPEVGALLRAQELGPLLPPETQRHLESTCIAAVKAKVEVAVAQELQLSEDRWPEDVTSQDMEEGLATRVTGLLRAHLDRAPQVTPEFGREMAHCLLGVLVAFLHSFQRKVERFLDAPGDLPPPEGAAGRAIALANCCPPLRALAERLAQSGHPESEGPRRQASAALERVTRTCGHLLTRRLLEELKPHFAKLMKRKWLASSDAFDAIVMLVTGFAQTLRPLHPEPHQVLVSELHRRVLLEYVRPLLQGRLVCASAKARARVAARLGDEARQLRELFSRLDSASPWLDSVVPRLRELLVLEDTAALQMEVGALARDFPDVRRRHVAALLDARGLRAQGPRREILGVLQDLEGSEAEPGPPRYRAFFSELPAPRPVRCLPFQLRLPRLPRRSPARTPP
ncbi:exocyst complex component 3-like protein 2 isoform X3 [Haemorhous mexicanus]|uniref:exocyst complex component 3-like protein 2 isoform X2 n=1 Tax=Haemorhous mexicanus TaxID=30427 RepID=UPI0028BD2179|nr:exocyst complex component 3-like protein 2 isoform X2 [Haemorhous mexicanus]XP_059728536.1 exocyst complex component 3-like protein 2 isoform X3 [Haemorhous mexicanus]